jgi:hypothetical protein
VSTLVIATRSYRPLAFRPSVERAVVVALAAAAAALWLLVLPVEIALHLT